MPVSPDLEALVDRLGREHARVHRVVDALERRDVHHARAVARDHHARRPESARLRPVAAGGDRLGPPPDALAALEDPRHERVPLELLQRVVHAEGRVAVVESADEAHRDPVLAHRVDERAAELLVLRAVSQRPRHRVDHAVERLLNLPDLLDPELPLLRVLGAEVEMADRRAGEVPLGAFGEHRRLRDQVGAGLEVRQLLAVAAAALVARANAHDPPVLDEQLRRGGLAEDVHAGLLRLVREPAAQLCNRRDVVAVVAERRRRRLEGDRALGVREQVDGVLRDGAVGRPVALREVREERLHRRRVHHRPGQQVRSGVLALLHERHRHLAERLHERLILGEELGQADRAGEAGRAAADDHDPDLDALVLGVGGRADEFPRGVDRRRKLDRRRAHQAFFAFTASTSFGMILLRSPTMPRSENSKIGAFGSLLMAMMFSEDCIPTLCWIAPEMPAAT